jgi:hypothetical protein
MEQRHALFEALELADARIVALDNAARGEQLNQDLNDFIAAAVCGLAEGLDGKAVCVTVHNQGGKLVGFSVDEAADFGVVNNLLAEGGGGADALGEEGAVNGNILTGHQTQGNLGAVAEKSFAEEATTLVGDTDNIAAGSLGTAQIAPINPEVAGGESLRAALGDHDLTFWH